MRAALLISVMLLGSPALGAGELEEGAAAFGRGEYDRAARQLLPLAESGHEVAQGAIGLMYAHGMGVAHDHTQGVFWLRQAAGKGDARAQYNLAALHLQGHAVRRNAGEAAKWLQMSARQGLAEAQYELALLYSNGVGVPHDHGQAWLWFELASQTLDHPERRQTAQSERNRFEEELEPIEREQVLRALRNWKPAAPHYDEAH